MRLVNDMNLSPDSVPFLHEHGFEAVHWSVVGAHTAPDSEAMQWVRDNARTVFTHDLDFGILLAHTRDSSASSSSSMVMHGYAGTGVLPCRRRAPDGSIRRW